MPFLGSDTVFPTMVEEQWYARLPFPEAQAQLGGPGVGGETIAATCGWHGSALDGERGCFAVVAADGPLADMVGERLAVRRRDTSVERIVYVYVHSDSTVLTEDLSLARRAFLAIGELALDELSVVVDVVAGAIV